MQLTPLPAYPAYATDAAGTVYRVRAFCQPHAPLAEPWPVRFRRCKNSTPFAHLGRIDADGVLRFHMVTTKRRLAQ